MVGARAAEAVVATHVENAIGLTRLLKGAMPVGQASEYYLREFSLPSSVAQMVSQRVQARIAGEELDGPDTTSRSRFLRSSPPRSSASSPFPKRPPKAPSLLSELKAHREVDLRRADVTERSVAGS